MDGDAFRRCETAVVEQFGNDSFVLGAHFYSDASLLSWSVGAFCAKHMPLGGTSYVFL